MERGSVHLFIVASKEIEEEEEIVLSLDTAICSPNAKSIKETPPMLQENSSSSTSHKKEEPPVPVPPSPPTPVVNSPVRKNGTVNNK